MSCGNGTRPLRKAPTLARRLKGWLSSIWPGRHRLPDGLIAEVGGISARRENGCIRIETLETAGLDEQPQELVEFRRRRQIAQFIESLARQLHLNMNSSLVRESIVLQKTLFGRRKNNFSVLEQEFPNVTLEDEGDQQRLEGEQSATLSIQGIGDFTVHLSVSIGFEPEGDDE